jgi:hypothetical protein
MFLFSQEKYIREFFNLGEFFHNRRFRYNTAMIRTATVQLQS